MVQVAELQRLLDELVGTRHVRGPAEHHDQSDQASGQEKNADNTDLREGIGAAAEDLRHRMLRTMRPRGGCLGYQRARRGKFRAECPPRLIRLVPCCEKRSK